MSNRQQAITWSSTDSVHWRTYPALGGDELMINKYVFASIALESSKWFKFILMDDNDQFILHSQYHDQGTSSHGIDLVFPECSSLSMKRITFYHPTITIKKDHPVHPKNYPYGSCLLYEVEGGYTGFTLSVCPSVDRIVSALYLLQYSPDPFHIYTSYQANSEGVLCVKFFSKIWSFGKFSKFVPLT